ncbi:Phosphoglycerate mutase family (Rhiz) [hydrothermal vent metagenome]|uniref:Phosphoglycerate mutase family (Rhiz) n=1 Tax=hydrothermal vent metagenome TaxID=652676 RepID=A0A1W1CVG1_9ZZZZ
MNLPTIILLRHGQTIWNVEGRYQGQLNSNLTDLGKKQAKNNALKIAKLIGTNPEIKFFSSPLGRAKETSSIICDTLDLDKNKIIFDDNIQEVNYGIFEGKTKEFCKKKYKKEFEAREANKWSYVLEGGESYEMVTKRIYSWLESVKDEKMVVLVAHEMINRALRGIYCSYDKEIMLKLRQNNNVVLKLENSKEMIVD